MARRNTTVMILALVMIVNALAYGIIIPLLYPYAAHFGIGPVGLSLLFASYSLFQFLATPIMGRLSDQYGRKPLLFFSLLGTSASLAMFAWAPNILWLFIARILDGITGGNISVAQAVIADSTEGPERARSMGILGASFGFGFLVGPALGGVLSSWGLAAPFWFAAALSLLAAWLMQWLLPETLALKNRKRASREALFQFDKMLRSLKLPLVGGLMWLTLLTSIAHFGLVIGFQSYTVDVLQMSAFQIGIMFSGLGIINILMQVIGIKLLLQVFKSQLKVLQVTLMGAIAFPLMLSLVPNLWYFGVITLLYSASFSPQSIMMVGLLSQQTNAEDQGGMLGINQSMQSLGQIIGPLLAGLATLGPQPAIFWFTSALFVVAYFLATHLHLSHQKANL